MNRNIGIATAYGYALSKGYTGTEEEFAALMAGLPAFADSAEASAQAAADAAGAAAQSESNAEAWAVGERDGESVTIDDDTFNNNAKHYSQEALAYKAAAYMHTLRCEAWTTGQIDGEDVPQSDPTYHNNAKYYADSAGETVSAFTETTAPAAVQAVNTAGQAQIGAVNTAGQTALTAVGEARTAAVNAVQQKGEEVLHELQDYADLPEDVADLKSAINTLQPAATDADVGKALIVETVDPVTGKPSSYKYGEAGGGGAPVIYNTASGAIAIFDDGAEDMPIKKLVVNIEPVQAGSGDPSPTNVRPISGWTAANVTRAGANIANVNSTEGFNNNIFAYDPESQIFTLKDAGAQTLWLYHKFETPAPIGTVISMTFVALSGNLKDKALILGLYHKSTGDSWASRQLDIIRNTNFNNNVYTADFTVINRPAEYIAVWAYNANIADVTQFKIQVEYGRATQYQPYTGEVTEYDFPSEAGTVYGGTLDVTNGVLTVDRIFATVDGSEDWNMYSTGKYYVNNVGSYYFGAAAGKYISNLYPFSGNGSSTSDSITEDKHFYGQKGSVTQNYRRIWVYDSSYSTLEDFKAALNLIPLQVVIPIASPIVYDLSGIPEITTLLGTNNIWADCGPVSVEYPADTKLYIERINAPTDDDMTADTQIDSGKYFLIGNTLYLSTTTIPAGDTIIPGTNCTKTDLAAALNALNA